MISLLKEREEGTKKSYVQQAMAGVMPYQFLDCKSERERIVAESPTDKSRPLNFLLRFGLLVSFKNK